MGTKTPDEVLQMFEDFEAGRLSRYTLPAGREVMEALRGAIQQREVAVQLCEMLRAGFGLKEQQLARCIAALQEILEFHFYGDHSQKYRQLLKEMR